MTMTAQRKYQLKVAAAGLNLLLAVVTAWVPDWAERLFAFEPDGGNGEFEWLLVAVPALLALGFALWARRDRLQMRSAAAAR